MALGHELTEARNERFLALLEPVYRDCERWAFSLAQDKQDADDVLSQSILIGLENIHKLKHVGAFKTWMFKIIATTFRQSLRQRKRQPDLIDHEHLSLVSEREDDWTERKERAKVLYKVLEELSPDQRQAILLFELHGFSIRDVSQIIGKKETAVRVLLHRGRQRLVDLLKEAGITPKDG